MQPVLDSPEPHPLPVTEPPLLVTSSHQKRAIWPATTPRSRSS